MRQEAEPSFEGLFRQYFALKHSGLSLLQETKDTQKDTQEGEFYLEFKEENSLLGDGGTGL